MRHRTFRIRRAALTLMLGTGVAGAVVTGSAGVADAAVSPTLPPASTPVVGSLATNGTVPAISSVGSNQAAAGLTVTLAAGTTVTGDYVDLVVSDSGAPNTGNGTVCFTAAPSYSTSGINTSAPTVPATTESGTACGAGAGDIVQIPITTTGALAGNATITLTNVAYSTNVTGAQPNGATGTLAVYGYLDSSATDIPLATTSTDVVGALSPTGGVSNATLPATPPAAPSTLAITAATSPTIGVGLANQPGGNLQVTLKAGAAGQGWQQGYLVAVQVSDTNGHNCNANDYVGFASVSSTATVTTTNWSTGTATPTVTPTRAYISPCGSSVANELLLTFGNSGTFPSSTSAFTITLTGLQYTSGTSTAVGPVTISGAYENAGGIPTTTTFAASNATATSGPSDAVVSATVITANTPPVSVAAGSLNAPISPVTLTEAVAGAVPDGYVCITLSNTGSATGASSGTTGTNAFDPASKPTVKVTSGPGTVDTSTVAFETVGGGTTDNTVVFKVTTLLPQTTASTYQVSGLGVDAAGNATGVVTAFVTTGAGSATGCPTPSSSTPSTTAYTVTAVSNRIYGSDAPGTAAAEMTATFPYSDNGAYKIGCPGSGGPTLTGGYTANRSVVMATDSNYPDALAGAYLASDLGTGELLTGVNTLPASTIQTLRLEGISQVYIVGGPYVVSDAVVKALQNTPVYSCGGVNPVSTLLGTAQDITVTRIYGQTEYDTAAQIAQFPGSSHVGTTAFPGAYAGTNSAGGNGMYNDTSGTASAAASSSAALPTAILATGQGFQDAESASVLSYNNDFPILLTTPGSLSPQAHDELVALGIQQVIVMGGPIAIANSVVTTLQGMGISVLRIAGTDFTDTAVQMAKFEMNTTGLGLGWAPQQKLYVARGDFYTDGLAGAVVAATDAGASCTYGTATGTSAPTPTTCPPGSQVPLLLTTNPSTAGTALTTFLTQAGTTGIDGIAADTVNALGILGGPLAVQNSTVTAMNTALNG